MASLVILALDLAQKTGWAYLDANERVESGVQVFDLKRGDSPGMRFLRFNKWLEEIAEKAELIVYEQTISGAFNPTKKGKRFTGAATREFLDGLATRVQEYCARREVCGRPVNHTVVYPSTLKKFAVGRGNAKKDELVAAARQRWGTVLDDNEADARWILEWARKEFERRGE